MRTRTLCFAFLSLLLLSGCTLARPIVTGQIGHAEAWSRPLDSEPLEQSFLIPEGGSDELELVAALPAGSQPPAALRWTLLDSAGRTVLAEGEVATASLQNNSPIHLALPPLPERRTVILTLRTAGPSNLRLWMSEGDLYSDGTLSNNGLQSESDLLITLRHSERPEQLPELLKSITERWPRVPQWLLLLATMPGWLAIWLLGSHRARPLSAAAPALALALVPLIHALLSVLGLHLYDPLSRSLLIGAALTTLLIALRSPDRLRATWRTRWPEALFLLLLAILLAIGSWLLASRAYLSLPGTPAIPSAVAARQIMSDGSVVASGGALPLASMTAILGLLTHHESVEMALLLALLLGVALVPSLFLLGSEVTRRPWAALVLLPLAWLWPESWQALAAGDLAALGSIALLPATVGLATNALTAPGRALAPLSLAAIALAGVALIQRTGAPLVLGIALALALWLRRFPSDEDPTLPAPRILRRAFLLLLLTLVALLPALWYSYGITPHSTAGYPLLLLATAIALLLRRLRWGGPLLAAIAVVALLPLAWWRAAPLPPTAPTLSSDMQRFIQQERQSGERGLSGGDGILLLAMHRQGERWLADEGSAWISAALPRTTTYDLQDGISEAAPTLLDRALAPGGLDDPAVRDDLRSFGIRYVLLDSQSDPLPPSALLGKPWVQQLYHVGSTYLFELSP